MHTRAKYEVDPSIGSQVIVRTKTGRTDVRTDGRTDRRTDGRPENIMPPAPPTVGGGIKITGSIRYLQGKKCE